MAKFYFSVSDLEYICKFYEHDGPKSIAALYDKPLNQIVNLVTKLKKQGKYEHYKNLNMYW